jgi:hemerythrin-like domain-containing protein
MTAPNDRVVAWGDELVKLHNGFRRRLVDLRRGTVGSAPELAEHRLSLCDALHAHHTEEDDVLFPNLGARNPELAEVLVRLRDEHRVIAAG